MLPRLKIAFGAAGLMSITLVACESPPSMQDFNHSFGEAINQNIAQQIVNPEPEDAAYPPTFDGARTDIEMQRYRNDKVKQPGPLRTSGIGSTTGSYGNPGAADTAGTGQ
jgi:hypothetical protein